MSTTEWVAIISALGTVLGTYLKFRYDKKKLIEETNSAAQSAEEKFRDDLMSRIRQLEEDAKTVDITRQKAVADYDELRKEMRRINDNTMIELATWRDRYYTLMTEHQKLKFDYSELNTKFELLKREHEELKAQYTKG